MPNTGTEGPGALAHGAPYTVTLAWYGGAYWSSGATLASYVFNCIGHRWTHNRWHVDNIYPLDPLPAMNQKELKSLADALRVALGEATGREIAPKASLALLIEGLDSKPVSA